MNILCTLEKCDIILEELSFSACKALVGQSFFQGIGVAKNIPRDSLDSFDIKLYCLEEDELNIDYDREPDEFLTGNLTRVRHGILQRTGPGITYLKQYPKEVKDAFSVYEDITLSFRGTDTEDGSHQVLQLVCQGGLCDITLADTSFGTCIDNIPGDLYLGGLAKAEGVPQDSLHNFDLKLFCTSEFGGEIDYSEHVALLKGDLIFLQNGISMLGC